MTTPDRNRRALDSFRAILSYLSLNVGLPPPQGDGTGEDPIFIDQPSRVRVDASLRCRTKEGPCRAAAVVLAISSAMFPLTSVEFCQSTFSSVLEKTT
jgi:hypothetical protein